MRCVERERLLACLVRRLFIWKEGGRVIWKEGEETCFGSRGEWDRGSFVSAVLSDVAATGVYGDQTCAKYSSTWICHVGFWICTVNFL